MSVVDSILHYQRSIERCSRDEYNEKRILHCLEKLFHLRVTVKHLHDTGIGRTVNSLRKCEGDVGIAAKELVAKWKDMVQREETSGEEVSTGQSEEERYQKDLEEENLKEEERQKLENQKKQEQIRLELEQEERLHQEKKKEEERLHQEQKKEEERRKLEEKKRLEKEQRIKKELEVKKKKEDSVNKRNHESERKTDKSKKEHHRSDNHHHRDHGDHRKKHRITNKSSSNHVDDTDESDNETPVRNHNVKRKSHKEKETKDNYKKRKIERDSESGSGSDESANVSEPLGSDCSSEEDSSSVEEETCKKTESRHRSSKSKDSHVNSSKEHKSNHKLEKQKEVSRRRSSEDHHRNDSKKHSRSENRVEEKRHSKDRHSAKSKSSASVERTNCGDMSPEVKVKLEKSSPRKSKVAEDGSIDCQSGASFDEALGFLGPGPSKKLVNPNKKKTDNKLIVNNQKRNPMSPENKLSANKQKSSWRSPSSPYESSASPVTNASSSIPGTPSEQRSPHLPLPSEPLDVNMTLTLPEINPNYRPLPYYNPFDSPQPRRSNKASEEEALSQVMSQKNQRTKVYSGVKSGKNFANIPSLFNMCVRILQANLDALEFTGGIPYFIMKPVLAKATPEQLYTIEDFNPYLIEDTEELWAFHCNRLFKNKQRMEMESSREMYMRCVEEREAKLKALTSNIQQSIAKSIPVRQTKLAYVDSFIKPPRNVARQQAKFGTAQVTSNSNPLATKPNVSTASHGTSAPLRPKPVHVPRPKVVKPKMAPLMQKTMKFAKSFKR